MVGNVAPRLAPHVFFGNLFFLQFIRTPVFGSNGALWSLANEFWYYILFPLGLIALWRTQRPAHRLLCVALFALTAWFIGASIFLSFPIWLAGVALFKLPPPSFTSRNGRFLRLGASLCYVPIFFGFGRLQMIGGLNRDYVFTILTTLFLWILLSANKPYPSHARVVQVSRESARFSYTLYANHVPFLVFLTAMLVGDSRWHPTPTALLSGFGILLVVLAYSWGIAFLSEFRTDALRLRLERLFGIANLPPVLPSNPMSETEPANLEKSTAAQ
jgi:peptidoglycan/LPS O-acetylase OafA/YrhL